MFDDDDRSDFADPGGRSALRAATKRNPRNPPCPNCGAKNVLTPADVAHGESVNSGRVAVLPIDRGRGEKNADLILRSVNAAGVMAKVLEKLLRVISLPCNNKEREAVGLAKNALNLWKGER